MKNYFSLILSLLVLASCSTKVDDNRPQNNGTIGGGGNNPPASVCLDLNAANQNQALPCVCNLNYVVSSDGRSCSVDNQNPENTVGSIVLSTNSLIVQAGSQTPLTVVVRNLEGDVMDNENVGLTYTVTPSNLGSVSEGNFLAQGQGLVTVTASAGGVASNPVLFTILGQVSNDTIASVEIRPLLGPGANDYTLNLNQTRVFVAYAFNSDGEVLNKNFTWTSSDNSIVAVNGGLVTALATGTAQITAASEGVESDDVQVTVVDTALIDLNLSPLTLELYTDPLLGPQNGQITGLLDTLGLSPVLGLLIDYQSLNPGIATVTANGLVSVNPSVDETVKTEIKATVNLLGIGIASINIPVIVYSQERLSQAVIVPLINTVLGVGGQATNLVAYLVDQAGNAIEDAELSYFSSNPLVATVNANGEILGISPGLATIIVVGPDGISASVDVEVTNNLQIL